MSCSSRVLYFKRAPHMDSLVFAPPERARFVDQLHRAIKDSQTSGQFRAALPEGEYARLFADEFSTDDADSVDDAHEPPDEEPFSSELVPGVCDGDYPPWLAAEQERYLPDAVLKEFGEREVSFVSGGFWTIPSSRRAAVVERLQAMGYTVEERKDLRFW